MCLFIWSNCLYLNPEQLFALFCNTFSPLVIYHRRMMTLKSTFLNSAKIHNIFVNNFYYFWWQVRMIWHCPLYGPFWGIPIYHLWFSLMVGGSIKSKNKSTNSWLVADILFTILLWTWIEDDHFDGLLLNTLNYLYVDFNPKFQF